MPTSHTATDSMGASQATPASISQSSGEDSGRQPVPILFIAGFGRSGSTLLDRLLGSTPGFHSGGELAGVWTQGLIEDRLCSCGVRFSVCPFWQAVGSNSFAPLEAHDIDAIVHYMNTILSARNIWQIFGRKTRRSLTVSAPANFFDITACIYRDVRKVSNRQVVVDSSKLAAYLPILAQMPSVNVSVVHLVRDPRAVAHSWTRPRVADPDGRSSMPSFGAVKSAVLWLVMNVAVEWTARQLHFPYVRIRYEDITRDPAKIVGQLRSEILESAEAGVAEADGFNDKGIDLGVIHSISGNPMRFQQGRMPVVEDTAWKSSPRKQRAIVAMITFPLRWRYGYGGVVGPVARLSHSKRLIQVHPFRE